MLYIYITHKSMQARILQIMRFNYLGILLVSFFVVRITSKQLISDEARAREFLRYKDETIIGLCEAGKDWSYFVLDEMTADDFAWQNFTDPLLRRAFRLTSDQERAMQTIDAEKNTEFMKKRRQAYSDRDSIFLNSGACVYQDEGTGEKDENCTFIPNDEIRKKFYKVDNADERKYYWVAWRDSVGKMKSIFNESLHYGKAANESYGYWLKPYGETSSSIFQDVEKAFQEILPLYKELHAFVRRRLINTYASEQIRSNGPIPSHLLGLTTDKWFAVKDVAYPYPEGEVDITKVMKERNMKTIDLLKLAEDFYHSVGLPKLDDKVWNNSKILNDENCTSNLSFQKSCKDGVSRVTACIVNDEFLLHILIGYMGEIYSNKWRRPDWPWLIHNPPGNDFSPAMRYLVQLSTWTNEYMALKGFVEAVPADSDYISPHEMNDLMKVALIVLPTLSYMYRATKWRFDSYTPTISDSNYNQKWWEYSLKYHGICPPVKRTEENFDPASSLRIALRYSILREFIGTVYSFQFHKAICEETGHNDLLHRCCLYGKRALGDKIRNITYLGNSIPVPEAISVMTNGRFDKMDTSPLLEYFRPLYEWLKIKNENETIGWQSEDPMVCP